MRTADDDAVCFTRLILPILHPVMHATACKSRVKSHMSNPKICKLSMLAMYSQSHDAFTGPWHNKLSHCCIFKTECKGVIDMAHVMAVDYSTEGQSMPSANSGLLISKA